MAKRDKLSVEAVQSALGKMPDWSAREGKLHREYAFADFTHAFGFMAAAATIAEAMNHHPDWRNVYNKVTVDLSTHDVGGLTELDLELARRLDALAAKLA